ncbi:methyl-accepting chemotaxis protein [Jannaschia seosinensis]|nr:methyl-accepting chemotaxis protein [Jannaschia seosinensis]
MALIGRTRGYALNIGALAVICATAATQEERSDAAEDLSDYCGRFHGAMEQALRDGTSFADMDKIKPQQQAIQTFLDRIETLPDRAMCFDRAEAVALANMARQEVLQAIYDLIAHVQERQDARLSKQIEQMAERSALLDRMTRDMSRISRMIGMVSINASVEAARAGGESGRTFKVISAEMRGLATQSSQLVAEMRSRLGDDAHAQTASGEEGQRSNRASRSASM